MFIHESGLCALIMKSNMPDAMQFQEWVTGEVLPSIREHGCYNPLTEQALPPSVVTNQINLICEQDLHFKVVDLIRCKFPEMILIPSLGEFQDTTQKRSIGYKSGYLGGQPDLIILNKTKNHDGFAIELKPPKGDGKLSDNQVKYLNNLSTNLKYKTLVSNDYDEIIIELSNYYNNMKYPCKHCSKVFNSAKTRDAHKNIFHNK